MKTKKILLALALPMAFAACSNEEFIENGVTPSGDNLIELGDNFVLAVQRSQDASRGVWESGNGKLSWSWIPDILEGAIGANSMMGASLNVYADEIGLCWTGELADGTGSISSKVYTNYQFLHNGWLAEDQEAADFDCDDLENGKLYSEITEGSLSSTSDLNDIKSQLTGSGNEVTVDGQQKALDLNTGVFSTSNKAIFGGSYIAYYPYNEDFVDAGTLPVKSATDFAGVTTDDVTAEHVAKNTVLVGYAADLIGGTQASKFSMSPVSGIISLQITGESKQINKVALWSENAFVTEVNLDASKIKANGAAAGEGLYVDGTKKTKSTVVAALQSDATLSTTATKIYIPVLPTTAKDLKVILYSADDKVAVVSTGKDYTIGAGKGVIVEVNAKDADFKSTKIAVDAATLEDAVKIAGTEAEPVNVTAIGDITLTQDVEVKSFVNVEGGKIIVPEDKTLTLADNSTVKSDVVVEGQSCCSTASAGGKLVVNAATVAGNVTVEAAEKEDKVNGVISFEATSEKSEVAATSTITVYGEMAVTKAADIYGDVVVSEDAEMAVTGEANFKGGKLTNDGEISVEDAAKFNILNANGETVSTAGDNFTNNGKFIDEVGAIVGGATQYMNNNGEYICKVADNNRMTEAYENKLACNIIEIVSTSEIEYTFEKITQHEYKGSKIDVDIVVSGNAVRFDPAKPITIGNLTIAEVENTTTGLRIMETDGDGDKAPYATITVNGDINAYGNFIVSEDVREMKAKNLYVHKNEKTGMSTQFENRNVNTGNTLVVAGTIEVEKDATFTIVVAADGKNTARVTCTKLVEGGTFNGKPIVVAE